MNTQSFPTASMRASLLSAAALLERWFIAS